jgi:hypothetical protein
MIYKVALLERRIGDVEQPLTVSEIRAELSLRFERINNNSNKDNGENSEEMAFYGGQFKGKCRNCGKIGQKLFQCKNRGNQNGGNNGGNTTGGIFVTIAASRDISSKTVSNSRKGTHKSTITTLTPVTVTLVVVIEKTMSHKIWFSRRHWMQKGLRMTFGFVLVVQVHTIVLQIEACLGIS